MGVKALPVTVEINLTPGHGFSIVGSQNPLMSQSRERIVSALESLKVPVSARISINLAPADLPKDGSSFDLPIALGIIAALGGIKQDSLERFTILGELGFDGEIHSSPNVLSIASQIDRPMIVPWDNRDDAAIVRGRMVHPAWNLSVAVGLLNNPNIPRYEMDKWEFREDSYLDFSDVKEQSLTKRAIEVAVAGGHNLLMIGPPGSGKSMMAQRIPGILPELTFEEAIETTEIYQAANLTNEIIRKRPFRSPHHTASDVSIIGGGTPVIRPGEISMAHNGVLFLDELPEFRRNALESLRQPLENKRAIITRANMAIEYPANFMLVCAMNPCPCGQTPCICLPRVAEKYRAKISGPLLDRIDIRVPVEAVPVRELSKRTHEESSADIRRRVVRVRNLQRERGMKNADIPPGLLPRFCATTKEAQELISKTNGSARAYDRILRVARTIADLSGMDKINASHMAEAISYRPQ